nr:UvrD-helicase domain-containing protein [Streptomyces curacoi]
MEEFERRLDREKSAGVIQLAAQAARIASGWSDEERPYRHIVVDEAQDLHAAHWKLLRALVPEGDDDLFIVGDAHQRIYDNRTSLSAHGINIRGRAKRLTLNYRTTRQILVASLDLLGNAKYDDLDGNPEQLRGYRSVLSGAIPETQGYRTPAEEMTALVHRVEGWQQEGIKPHEIAVVARTHALTDAAVQALRDAKLDAVKVEDSRVPDPDEGVQAMTMHRIKGLEYRAVAIVGTGAQHMPLPTALTPEAEDRLQYAADLRREQSLLFVSATRASSCRSLGRGRPASSCCPPIPSEDMLRGHQEAGAKGPDLLHASL